MYTFLFVETNQIRDLVGSTKKKKKKRNDKITVLVRSPATEDQGVHLPETRSTDRAVSVGCRTADTDGSDPVR